MDVCERVRRRCTTMRFSHLAHDVRDVRRVRDVHAPRKLKSDNADNANRQVRAPRVKLSNFGSNKAHALREYE